MHQSDEQRRALLKQAVAQAARDLLRDKDELLQKSKVMHQVWGALLQQQTWRVVESMKPKDFDEPEEIWSVTPTITRK